MTRHLLEIDVRPEDELAGLRERAEPLTRELRPGLLIDAAHGEGLHVVGWIVEIAAALACGD